MTGYSECFVTSGEGLRLYVRDYRAAWWGRRAPVICLHGLTRNSADFEIVAPNIAATRRRVFAVDMRGRGRSDRDPDPSRYRPDVYANDVLKLMDDLVIKRAIFIGTSMGGIITMVLAALAPDRIAASILNDVGPVINPAGIARIARYVGKIGPFDSWEDIISEIKTAQTAVYPNADEAFWRKVARRVASQLPDGRVVFNYDPAIIQALRSASSGPSVDMKPLFSALASQPILVIRGALSDILTPDGVAAMREVKPNLPIVNVPDVGHAPTLEEVAAQAAIAKFLEPLP